MGGHAQLSALVWHQCQMVQKQIHVVKGRSRKQDHACLKQTDKAAAETKGQSGVKPDDK